MGFQFPASPTLGQVYNAAPGVQYTWNGTGWSPTTSVANVAEGLFPDGTTAAPAISWLNEPSAGFRRRSAGVFDYVIGGANKLTISSIGTELFGSTQVTSLTVTGQLNANSSIAVGGEVTVTSALWANENIILSTNNNVLYCRNPSGGLAAAIQLGTDNKLYLSSPTTVATAIYGGNKLVAIDNNGIYCNGAIRADLGNLRADWSGFQPGSGDQGAVIVNGNNGGGLVFFDGSGRCGVWTAAFGDEMIFGAGGTASGIPTRPFLINKNHIHSYVQAYKPGGGSWADNSDARIKNVLGTYDHGLAEIKQLNPVRYTFKGNYSTSPPDSGGIVAHAQSLGKEFIGVIAQEIETVLPETVTRETGYIDGRQVDDVRILDTNAILYALINAVKDLNDRDGAFQRAIEELTTRVKLVERKL